MLVMVVLADGALSSCAVGRWHTSDSRLETNFLMQRNEFDRLVASVESDASLHMISTTALRYGAAVMSRPADIEATGMKREMWERYQHQMRRLNIRQVTKSDSAVILKVDEVSIANGDSEKGYWYQRSVPGRIVKSLDLYSVSDADRDQFGNYSVFREMAGNWYLYLFINR